MPSIQLLHFTTFILPYTTQSLMMAPMKVLFINARKSDYLQDGVYTGLVKTLGAHNVVDYPFNLRLHLNIKAYPKNTGYQPGTLLPRLLNSIQGSLKSYDTVIVGSSSPLCIERYLEIKDHIPDSTPIIFLDGGDREEIAGDLLRAGRKDLFDQLEKGRPFDLIFKREMLVNKDYESRVKPLPFCFNLDLIPPSTRTQALPKKYNVSFWAVESHPIRTRALELLENQFDCRANGTERNQTFKKYARKGHFYLEEIHRCKIALNLRGGGWDTLRYWEVPAMKTFMLSQKPQIRIDHNFVDGESVVFVKDDLSDLIEKCEYYLKNEEAREQIARQGFEHLKKFHLDIHRAETVIESIRRL